MHVLGKRYVYTKAEYQAQVRPPEDALQSVGDPFAHARVLEQACDYAAYGSGSVRPLASCGNVKCLGQQGQRHKERDERQDYRRLFLLRQVEGQAVRLYSPTSDSRPGEYDKENQRHHVQVIREYLDACFGD